VLLVDLAITVARTDAGETASAFMSPAAGEVMIDD